MPKEIFTIEHNGELLDVEADSPEEALSFVQGQGAPAAPQPDTRGLGERAIEGAITGSERFFLDPRFQGAAAASGLAAPIVGAAATGAPMLPVIGGVAAGMGAGALTDYALRETGATPKLEELARGLRQGTWEPETQSVPLNFAINYMKPLFSGRERAAQALEAAPQLAAMYAAGRGGLAAARGLAPRTLPPQQAAGQVQQLMSEQFGTAPAPRMGGVASNVPGLRGSEKPLFQPQTAGQMAGQLKAGSEVLGAKVGEAKRVAYEAARPPANMGATVRGAVRAGMQERGVPRQGGEFVPALSKSPEAASRLMAVSDKTAPRVRNIQEANALQQRLSEMAKQARVGDKRTSAKAAMFEGAERSVDRALKSLIPKAERSALEQANKPFAGFTFIEEMARKSKGSRGEFDPQGFLRRWNSVKPEEKAKYLSPEQIAQWDSLLKQDVGMVRSAIRGLKGLRNTISGAERPKPPVLFQQPSKVQVAPIQRAILGGTGPGAVGATRFFEQALAE